jgi:exosome complex component RRP40
MSTTQTVLLPGDHVPASELPAAPKRKIGYGLRDEADGLVSTVAGLLQVDHRRKTVQVATAATTRYVPKAGDLVIAQFRASSTDFFHLYLTAHSAPAILPQLAFEGATKKTRPQLRANDLVYARVVSARKNMEVELSCVNPATGKAEPDGLGPLTGATTSMVFDVSPGLAARLSKRRDTTTALDDLGARVAGGFELAVGMNGKVWVDCPEAGVRGVCAVGRCLGEMDERPLSEKEQKKLVNRLVADLERG